MRARTLLAAVSLSLAACSGSRVGDVITIRCGMDDPPHQGEATYYDASGRGSCSFAASSDPMVAAINQADEGGSAACGACVNVEGPAGSVVVRIVDRCPGCAAGDLDLNREAFARIADLAAGRVAITWRYVACPVTGPVHYRFKESSNAKWIGVQIRNHRFPVADLEVRSSDGTYRSIPRQAYNYFVDPSGLGAGPYTFRVIDARGQVLDDTGVRLAAGQEIAGADQFPSCANAKDARKLPQRASAPGARRDERPAHRTR